jgi:hypothetical protein
MGVSSSTAPKPATEPPPRAPVASENRVSEARRPLTTGVWANPFVDVAVPASFAASGAQQGAAGVGSDVAGAFSAMIANVDAPPRADETERSPRSKRTRVWFCAIDGQPRGPYVADELLTLAHKGQIRSSTLLWRPGTPGWQPLRKFVGFDVAWLLDAVHKRKQQEQRAEQDLLRRRGIVPVQLERRIVRAKSSSTANPGSVQQSVVADELVFEAPDGPGALPSPRGPGDVDASPLVWRASPTASSAAAPRPARGRRWLLVSAVVVVAAVVTVGGVVALARLSS